MGVLIWYFGLEGGQEDANISLFVHQFQHVASISHGRPILVLLWNGHSQGSFRYDIQQHYLILIK